MWIKLQRGFLNLDNTFIVRCQKNRLGVDVASAVSAYGEKMECQHPEDVAKLKFVLGNASND